MESTTFKFKGIEFTVKISNRLCPGRPIYRDSAHLGGPWSLVETSIQNKSLDIRFRRALESARQRLLNDL